MFDDDVPSLPYRILRHMRVKLVRVPPQPPLPIEPEPPAPIAAKPRRKGLGPKQLKWLRANCQPFKDMEARAKASKLVGSKAK